MQGSIAAITISRFMALHSFVVGPPGHTQSHQHITGSHFRAGPEPVRQSVFPTNPHCISSGRMVSSNHVATSSAEALVITQTISLNGHSGAHRTCRPLTGQVTSRRHSVAGQSSARRCTDSAGERDGTRLQPMQPSTSLPSKNSANVNIGRGVLASLTSPFRFTLARRLSPVASCHLLPIHTIAVWFPAFGPSRLHVARKSLPPWTVMPPYTMRVGADFLHQWQGPLHSAPSSRSMAWTVLARSGHIDRAAGDVVGGREDRRLAVIEPGAASPSATLYARTLPSVAVQSRQTVARRPHTPPRRRWGSPSATSRHRS